MRLYKIFVYVALSILAIIILVPVLWVLMASVKETAEHYGSPWALPSHIHWQNFVNAWTKANMGGYMLHSVMITALALVILLIMRLSWLKLASCAVTLFLCWELVWGTSCWHCLREQRLKSCPTDTVVRTSQ